MYTTDGSIIIGEERHRGEVIKPGTRVSYRGIADETKTHYYEIRVMESGKVQTIVDRDIYSKDRPCLVKSPTLNKLQHAFALIGTEMFLRRDSESYWHIKNAIDTYSDR